jgi:hypothetical protein
LVEAYMKHLAADAAASSDVAANNPATSSGRHGATYVPGAAAEAVRRLLGITGTSPPVSPLLGTNERAQRLPGSASGALSTGEKTGTDWTPRDEHLRWAPYQLPTGVFPAGRSEGGMQSRRKEEVWSDVESRSPCIQPNSQNPQLDVGPFAMPPSLPTSPHRTANPASVSPPHRAQESTFLWRESDPWKQQNTEGAAKLSDVIQIANYMQDILSDRNRLALDQSAKIQELELVRVQYAEEIGSLKGLVSKLEDRMRSHNTDLADRNRLALDQSAKIQELELVRVQYAEEIGCLKGMVSKLEDRMRSHSTDLSAEIEAILKEVSAPGFAEHQQRNSDGKPNSPARFTHTRTHARTHTRRLDANL